MGKQTSMPMPSTPAGTRYTEMESSIGTLVLAGDADGTRLRGLQLIWLPGGSGKFRPEPDWVKDARPFGEVIRQLREYLAGKREVFAPPLAPGGRESKREVWRAVAAIPYGETRSYGDIARQIGRVDAVRAGGGANGQNPLPPATPLR